MPFLNPFRVIQLATWAVCWMFIAYNDYDYDSSMLFTNLSMVICLLLILWNSSLTSVKFILTFLLYSVAIVPGIAYFLLGFKIYSYINIEHQLNDWVTARTQFIYFTSLNIFSFLVLAKDDIEYQPAIMTNQTRFPFFIFGIISLICVYVTESGETLITSNYSELMEQRSGFMTLAGVALAAFWSNMYAKYREYCFTGYNFRKWTFILISVIAIIWFVLHARRTELIGFLAVLLMHQRMVTGKTPYKYIALGLLFLVLLYVIGHTRVAALTDIDAAQVASDSFSLTWDTHHTNIKFANMPSGIGNVSETLATTVYHFDHLGNDYINGKSIFSYPYKLIPSNLINALNLPSTEQFMYNKLVLDKYFYNGGTYLLSPAYGNFGMFGIVLASIILALIIRWVQRAFYSNDFIKVAIATIVIFHSIKAIWYNPLPIIKAIFYNLIFLGSIALIFYKKERATKLIKQ